MSLMKKNVKIPVALRTARAAIGWNQQEFADEMGVAKSTIARVETLEVSPRADLLLKAMELFERAGIEVDFFKTANLTVVISPRALDDAEIRLMSQELRRTDRKGPLTIISEQIIAEKKAQPKRKGPLTEITEQRAKNRLKPNN